MNFKFELIVIKLIRYNFLKSISYKHKLDSLTSHLYDLCLMLKSLSLSLIFSFAHYIHTLPLSLSISILYRIDIQFSAHAIKSIWTKMNRNNAVVCVSTCMHLLHMSYYRLQIKYHILYSVVMLYSFALVAIVISHRV